MKELMVKRWFLVGAWAALAFMSYDADASARCVNGIPETSGSDIYQEVKFGEIKHAPSNLVFMRCAIGQTFENGQCSGIASLFTWQQALQLSVGYEYNGSSNWRLPNIKELSVIVERACVRPSINEGAFPATPPDEFWTSTPSMQDPERAWSIAFFNGTSSIKAKDRSVNVRLVRTALSSE
jgi:hypothetical protein